MNDDIYEASGIIVGTGQPRQPLRPEPAVMNPRDSAVFVASSVLVGSDAGYHQSCAYVRAVLACPAPLAYDFVVS